jgi:hypothetical protein
MWHQRPPTPLENVNQDLTAAILRLRLQTVAEQISQLEFLLRGAEETGDQEHAHLCRETISRYSRQRRLLHDTVDALSLMGKRRAESRHYGEPV